MYWPVWISLGEFANGQRFSANAHANILADRQNVLYGMAKRYRRLFQQSWRSGSFSVGMPSCAWQGSGLWKSYLRDLEIMALWKPVGSPDNPITLYLQLYIYQDNQFQWVTIDSETYTSSPPTVVAFKGGPATYDISGYTFYNGEVRVRLLAGGTGTISYLRVCEAKLKYFYNLPYSWTNLSFSNGVVYNATKFNQLRANQEYVLHFARDFALSNYSGLLSVTNTAHDVVWIGTFQYIGAGEILAVLNVENADSSGPYIDLYICNYTWHSELGGGQTRILVERISSTGLKTIHIDLTNKGLTNGNYYALFIEMDEGARADIWHIYYLPRSNDLRPSSIEQYLCKEYQPGETLTAEFLNAVQSDLVNMLNGSYRFYDHFPLATYNPYQVKDILGNVLEGPTWDANATAREGRSCVRLTNFYRWLYYRGTNVRLESMAQHFDSSTGKIVPDFSQSLPDAPGPIVCADLAGVEWMGPGRHYKVVNAWVAYEFWEPTI